MNPEPGEFRDFPEPFVLVNDDVAHPFSSPIDTQTVNQPLIDLPGVNDSSFYSNISFKNAQSMESDILDNNNNIKTKIIENNHQVEEHVFDNDINQEKILNDQLTNIKPFDINEYDLIIKYFKYLEIESKRAQQITTHFEK